MRAGAATVVDMAAYLGVTPARIRQIVKEHDIQPTGVRWKAKLYDPEVVFKAAGPYHRSVGARKGLG